ncbi:methylenetetrahydrofolate--tRNA-(uracil(54)-C(5))-methyltransferase (FADH(2)-oxidizing) TrmFO [Zhaonella formicivorans]|uniref:methylenetetrahydrofolate--tRNA-(uracil(54)- C(5))-methyltransferase (FADH(2)-oxidizing) TrmFO n=1 Tax=Zhaonella formicivorans TaxID=2528593 RepID=UPI0010EBFD90|nr:methylenetetrahydrofolate--tRNA-(uracil(54)-C(5))-methyltransferase (FADH(2)-oxidizing) TrmFO [Zhaonella formicivorans]
MCTELVIIGGGLAGAEAAWQAAQRGVKVKLYEMRPYQMTPAHHSSYLAELVCSNSLRANAIENAVGLLKEEMRNLNSLIMHCADKHAVPAGGALAVDRNGFSSEVTEILEKHPNVQIIREEITDIPNGQITIIASGPLTSPALAAQIQEMTSADYFYFYDAAAPIVTKESIDCSVAFWASRYGKGSDDYLNCPMTEEEYDAFYSFLVSAERHEPKEFEKEIHFEGCMPIEALAKGGKQTLLFGPMKPVGLVDPRTGKMPYAVVQLRKDNQEGSLFNLVGFQTGLKWGEQQKLLKLIPGLEKAEIVRYGVMHKNTYISSPDLLLPTMQFKKRPEILFAGQITGVEGYVESAANGLVAGINAARIINGQQPLVFPPETAHGALCHYITTAETKNFQPMNINFGLIPPLEHKQRDKKLKNRALAERALTVLWNFMENNKLS